MPHNRNRELYDFEKAELRELRRKELWERLLVAACIMAVWGVVFAIVAWVMA